MKRSRLNRIGLYLIVISIIVPAFLLQADSPQDKSCSIMTRTCITELPSLAKISYQDAVKTALAETPGGVLEVELEDEGGFLVFCVEIVTEKGEILEYLIDAGNGAVLGVEEDDDDEDEMKPGTIRVSYNSLEYPKMAKINLDKAVKTAMDQVDGKFLAAELEGDDGILLWEVIIVTAKKAVMEVEIDAATGKILEIEEEEYGDDED